jgi:hypothetical protein
MDSGVVTALSAEFSGAVRRPRRFFRPADFRDTYYRGDVVGFVDVRGECQQRRNLYPPGPQTRWRSIWTNDFQYRLFDDAKHYAGDKAGAVTD